jgi:hypothetical protein
VNFWIGHSVLGLIVPGGAGWPSKPTQVPAISGSAPWRRRRSANPRQPGTRSSSRQAT